MNKYLKEAKKYYKIALDELKKSSINGKIELAVDGCEKGWLSVILATNALFLKKGEKEEKLPKTQRGRRYFLIKYATREERSIFYKSYGLLHIDGFYERLIDYELIFECLEDVKEFINKIENE